MKYPAPGLDGGGFGAAGAVWLNGEPVTRFIPIQWQPGEEVILRVPGGAGYGDPQAREPERVREDVALGYVSVAAARQIYGLDLALDTEAMQIESLRRYVRRET